MNRRPLLPLLTLVLAALLIGCGMGPITTSNSGTLAIHGNVHGGQQGVAGATVQLYAVGTLGNGSAATPLIASSEYYPGGAPGCIISANQTCLTSVTSDSSGFFTITGDYTCPSTSTQVYIVASGGNPGLAPGTNNTSLVMMTALGSCGNLMTNLPYVTINEVTTAAAAWALAPFMLSASQVGSTSTNSAGIANAFLDAALIANTSTGVAATLPSNLTIEPNKLYALADALATCVNTAGGSACSPLFSAATPSGGTAPTNTLTAALSIVKNPGQNVAAVYAVITGTPPFATAYTQAPNDWTMSMTVTDPSFLLPTAMDIDANGYVWAVGQEGTIYEINPQGTVLSGAGFGIYTEECFGLTIDTGGNIWVSDFQSAYTPSGALVAFQGSNGTPGQGINFYYDNYNSIQYPDALSADTNGNVYVMNSYNSSASIYNTSTTQGYVAGFLGSQYDEAADPQAIAVDNSHGFWMSDGEYTVSHYNEAGTLLSNPVPNCCYGSYGMAVDSGSNVWVANYSDSTFSELTNANAVTLKLATGGGLASPSGVTIDAAQNVWFTNYRGQTISEIAGNGLPVLTGTTTPLTAGTPISPSTGTYGGNGGYGLDASLSLPIASVPDSSGNVWVANEGNNDFVMFFGLATPTKMPVLPTPTAP
jgi:streptogramin lyase